MLTIWLKHKLIDMIINHISDDISKNFSVRHNQFKVNDHIQRIEMLDSNSKTGELVQSFTFTDCVVVDVYDGEDGYYGINSKICEYINLHNPELNRIWIDRDICFVPINTMTYTASKLSRKVYFYE